MKRRVWMHKHRIRWTWQVFAADGELFAAGTCLTFHQMVQVIRRFSY